MDTASNSKAKILIQLDPDKHPSSFDAVVAVDAGIDHLLAYGGVSEDEVESLVHGAMFTRGVPHLSRTAIFIGGTDVQRSEALLEKVRNTFFGPMRVSVMMDANGANTTAVAAVLNAQQHLTLSSCRALVLGGTGPVGQRVARLLLQQGASVQLASRHRSKAEQVCQQIGKASESAEAEPVEISSDEQLSAALAEVSLVIAAGAAGVRLLPASVRDGASSLRVVIDLNAVPPEGIEGVEPTARAEQQQDGVIAYGALGVGALKMKIHKAALRQLYQSNDQVLDAESILEIASTQV